MEEARYFGWGRLGMMSLRSLSASVSGDGPQRTHLSQCTGCSQSSASTKIRPTSSLVIAGFVDRIRRPELEEWSVTSHLQPTVPDAYYAVKEQETARHIV